MTYTVFGGTLSLIRSLRGCDSYRVG